MSCTGCGGEIVASPPGRLGVRVRPGSVPISREEAPAMPEQPDGAAYDGGPIAALRRVAFLMERGREETRRVQAFRNAAATLLPLPDDEVADRVEAGTLTELAGIGPSTA